MPESPAKHGLLPSCAEHVCPAQLCVGCHDCTSARWIGRADCDAVSLCPNTRCSCNRSRPQITRTQHTPPKPSRTSTDQGSCATTSLLHFKLLTAVLLPLCNRHPPPQQIEPLLDLARRGVQHRSFRPRTLCMMLWCLSLLQVRGQACDCAVNTCPCITNSGLAALQNQFGCGEGLSCAAGQPVQMRSCLKMMQGSQSAWSARAPPR